jgi:hypothetical protein
VNTSRVLRNGTRGCGHTLKLRMCLCVCIRVLLRMFVIQSLKVLRSTTFCSSPARPPAPGHANSICTPTTGTVAPDYISVDWTNEMAATKRIRLLKSHSDAKQSASPPGLNKHFKEAVKSYIYVGLS